MAATVGCDELVAHYQPTSSRVVNSAIQFHVQNAKESCDSVPSTCCTHSRSGNANQEPAKAPSEILCEDGVVEHDLIDNQ